MSRAPSAARLRTGLFCALLVAQAAAEPLPSQPSTWQGTLEVIAQSGPGCTRHPSPPYRLRVEAAQGLLEAGSLLVWGELQAARLAVSPDASGSGPITLLGERVSVGTFSFSAAGTDLRGRWHEQAATDSGDCAFIEARLHAAPTPTDAVSQAVLERGRRLLAVQQGLDALKLAADRAAAEAAVATLAGLAPSVSRAAEQWPPWADLAVKLIEAADIARALRRHAQAQVLLDASSALYRRLAHWRPEDAALGLAREATLHHRLGRTVRAAELLTEAQDVLLRGGLADGEAAAHLLSLRGAWALRGGDCDAAAVAFERALSITVERRGGPLDLAAARNNVAQAWAALGRHREALEQWQRALAEVTGASDTGVDDTTSREQLADIIREAIDKVSGNGSRTRHVVAA